MGWFVDGPVPPEEVRRHRAAGGYFIPAEKREEFERLIRTESPEEKISRKLRGKPLLGISLAYRKQLLAAGLRLVWRLVASREFDPIEEARQRVADL